MHRQYKGIGLAADVKVLRILQLAEVHLAGKPGMYKQLRDEVQNASHGVAKMIAAIPSPDWIYHALRGEQHILDVRLGKLIDEWASNTDLTAPDTDPPETEPPAVDLAMTANQDELIDAFGAHSGMKQSWFDRWGDKSGLKQSNARKGRKGKHSTQPLFYVFPVMQWLCDPKLKVKGGKPIQQDTAWRILENKFRRVYAEYQSHDPRIAG